MGDIALLDKSNLPAHLQGQSLGVSEQALVGVFMGGNRIGLKGNRFRQVVNGEEVGVYEENYLDVVFVGFAEATSRVYYETDYDSDEKASPNCYSANGIEPNEDVKHKMNPKCATCPMNEKGSKIVGNRKTKACSYFRRVVVALPWDLGTENDRLYTIDVKAMGLFGEPIKAKNQFNLNDYIKYVANRGVDLGHVVTRLAFDPNESVPKLLFAVSRFVNEDEFVAVKDHVESGEPKNLTVVKMNTIDLSGERVAEEEQEEAQEAAPEQSKPAQAPAQKPAQKPAQTASKPAQKPAQTASKPAQAPAQKPAQQATTKVDDDVPPPAKTTKAAPVAEVVDDDELNDLLAGLE